jgi:undecaprenyl pyrophosphate phosphatase UppP
VILVANSEKGRLLRDFAPLPLLFFKGLPISPPGSLVLTPRFWRVLRRRATHNRLFTTMAELRAVLRASFCYFHTMRHKVLSLIHSPRKRKEAKLTAA